MSRVRTIGVLGGGQLGRMIALAGIPMGYRFRFLDPGPDSPARDVGELVIGRFEDEEALRTFAQGIDVATYEFENVPVSAVERLAQWVTVHPGAASLAGTQDRLVEKRTFNELGVPTTRYEAVDSRESLLAAVDRIGCPCVVKTRREGYDGKGQTVVRAKSDAEHAWDRLGARPLLVEEFVAFDREVSIIGVRGATGECRFYPLAENVHERGILRHSRVPAHVTLSLQSQAEGHAQRVMERFGHVGVFTIEFFLSAETLIANEMAPRVHNSGHWTIDGAVTSQFENHVRAITGMPLGTCAVIGPSAMVNIVGKEPTPGGLAEMLATPGIHVHSYAKSPREGRKIGHATAVARDGSELERLAARLLELCPHC